MSSFNGQALKNCISFISKNSRRCGRPEPMAMYAPIDAISVMPKITLLNNRVIKLMNARNKSIPAQLSDSV